VPDRYDEDAGPQVHLGVFFTGVGPQLIWADPSCASHHAIETFTDVVQILERGLFDAFFLGEGLRVRENRGKVFDLDVSGRPDAITQLAALAAVTDRIGLVATQNATYNYPADLARRLASLDYISGGRAGWNIVTTDNAWTGENFRHGGWLPHERRYERATQFVEAAKELWESDPGGAPVDVSTDLVRFRSGLLGSYHRVDDLVDADRSGRGGNRAAGRAGWCHQVARRVSEPPASAGDQLEQDA
jgi:alkanesulfonate monooxygenase SsuD/methylene tetrahydromethanopterin reductase-like flavin-dependent oxidoreductase (luciferase family)